MMQSIDIQVPGMGALVRVRCGVGFAWNISGTGPNPWVIKNFTVCSRDNISEIPLAPTFLPCIGIQKRCDIVIIYASHRYQYGVLER